MACAHCRGAVQGGTEAGGTERPGRRHGIAGHSAPVAGGRFAAGEVAGRARIQAGATADAGRAITAATEETVGAASSMVMTMVPRAWPEATRRIASAVSLRR